MEQWAVRSNNSLQHYGVKGMKWGVRKEEPSTSKIGKALNIKKVTTVSKGIPLKEFNKLHPPKTQSRIEKALNIQSHSSWGGVTNTGGSDRNKLEELLNIQEVSEIDEGIPIDEYFAKQKAKDLKKKEWKNKIEAGKTAVVNAIASIKSRLKGAAQSAGQYLSKAVDSGKKWLEKTLNIKKVSKTTKVVIDNSPPKKRNALEKLFNVREGDSKVTRWTASGKEEYVKYKKNK